MASRHRGETDVNPLLKKTLRFFLFGLLALVITAGVAIFLIVKLALCLLYTSDAADE